MTSDHYLAQIQALLPRGAAWPTEPDLVMTETLRALADELARVDARADDLLDEADPRTTGELLTDWEQAYALPDPCTSQPDITIERRAALVEKVARIGGQTPQYFIDVAALLGFTITITEYRPFRVGINRCGDELLGEPWWFAWRVNGPLDTFTYFICGRSRCGDPLRDWGNDLLECVIRRLAPAHTVPIFSYT